MKIKSIVDLQKVNDEKYTFPIIIGKGPSCRRIELEIVKGTPEFEKIEKAKDEPTSLYETDEKGKKSWSGTWIYKNKLLFTEYPDDFATKEDILRMKHFVLKKEKELERITKEVDAFENFDKAQGAKRERISDDVRLFVWQRDEGRCVKCGNKEKLEFDHIIPVVEGGGNTERNIQLLCETCNRSKGKKI